MKKRLRKKLYSEPMNEYPKLETMFKLVGLGKPKFRKVNYKKACYKEGKIIPHKRHWTKIPRKSFYRKIKMY